MLAFIRTSVNIYFTKCPLQVRHSKSGKQGRRGHYYIYFLKRFSSRGPFLKSLLNLLQYFCIFFFGGGRHEASGILALWPGIESIPTSLDTEMLTSGPPWSPYCVYIGAYILEHLCSNSQWQQKCLVACIIQYSSQQTHVAIEHLSLVGLRD